MPARAYRAYGLVFSSDIAFPDLPRVATRSARPAIRLMASRRRLDASGWRDETPRPDSNGRPWLVVSKRRGAFRLRFGDLADFVVDASGRAIEVYRHRATPLSTLRHLALNQVLPLTLGHRGRTVLHASAFAMDGRAVALLGPAGAGKSTLVASFAAHGWPMMADDAVLLVRRASALRIVPAYGDVRVWPDTYAMLRGVRKPVPFHGQPLPLAAVYVLSVVEAGAAVRIDRLSRRDAVIELLQCSFVLDVTDRGGLLAQFDRLTRDLPLTIRRIAYPRDFDALARVRDAILEDQRGGGSAASD